MAALTTHRVQVRLTPVARRVQVLGLPKVVAGDLAAVAFAASLSAGMLSVVVSLIGAGISPSRAAGDIGVGRPLAAVTSASAATAADLTVVRGLAASTLGSAQTSGTLQVANGISGASSAASQATGTLTVQRSLSAAALAQSASTGAISATVSPSASTNAQSVSAGAVTVERPLAAAGAAPSVASAVLTVSKGFDGASAATSSTAGVLTVARPVAATTQALAVTAGTLTVTKGLSAATSAPAASSGALTTGGGAAFTDDFNRADELLNASANWTLVDGTASQMGVRSNQLAALGSAESTWLSPDRGSANHYLEATLVLVGANGPFLIGRATNANSWVGLRNSASQYQVFKRVAGTLTQIGGGNVTPAVGDRIRLEVAGDLVTLLINGAAQASATNVALGGDLAGVTRTGVIARTAARNPWIDDYKAGVL